MKEGEEKGKEEKKNIKRRRKRKEEGGRAREVREKRKSGKRSLEIDFPGQSEWFSYVIKTHFSLYFYSTIVSILAFGP